MNNMVDLFYTLALALAVTYILYCMFGDPTNTNRNKQKKEQRHQYAISYFFYEEPTGKIFSYEITSMVVHGPLLEVEVLVEQFLNSEVTKDQMRNICAKHQVSPSDLYCGFYSINYLGNPPKLPKGTVINDGKDKPNPVTRKLNR